MRAFAVIPAAGLSTRMGSPKLLLPWREQTVFEQVLSTWSASQVAATVVVVGPDSSELALLGRKLGALVVEAPTQPPDMKASVRLGLQTLEAQYAPSADDAWLLAPADMPLLTAALIDRVIAAWRSSSLDTRDRIVAPQRAGKRGHPVLFPWPLAKEVFSLADNEGINTLVDRAMNPLLVSCDDSGMSEDLDTPDDYRRLRPS